MPTTKKTLKPIVESNDDFETLEKKIRQLFLDEIYLPLLRELGMTKFSQIQNGLGDGVSSAIKSDRIFYSGKGFQGRFDAKTSLELKQLGAKFNKSTSTFEIPLSKLPVPVRNEIASAKIRYNETTQKLTKKITQILPDVVAKVFNPESVLDKSLLKTKRKIDETMKGITVQPKLTDDMKKNIITEYSENLKKDIKKWTDDEVITLRKQIENDVFDGRRIDDIAKSIQRRYEVSESKAKFLARQETSLMNASLKKQQYTEAGFQKYKWKTVVGSPNHPVREAHKKLDGKIFSWNNPPITDTNGSRNNPGEDYNCRCYAIPVIN